MVAVMVRVPFNSGGMQDETHLHTCRLSGLQDILTWITSREKRKKAG